MKSHFTRRTVFQRSLASCRWLPLAGLALTTLGCAGDVEVGEAKPEVEEQAEEPSEEQEPEDTDDGIEEPETPAEEPETPAEEPEEVDCSEADAAARAPYEAWQEIGNDFGELAGKTLSGYIEAGPDLLLTIESDHSATLVVGEAAPEPEKNLSYLCENEFADTDLFFACEVARSQPPVFGGSYPLHGATLEDSRLKVPLQVHSPWDPWCALQDPHEQEQDVRCFFTPDTGGPFSMSAGGCTLNDEVVDCGWLSLIQGNVCRCTSTECFALIGGDGELLDARLNETGDGLVGSFRGATVYLFIEEE